MKPPEQLARLWRLTDEEAGRLGIAATALLWQYRVGSKDPAIREMCRVVLCWLFACQGKDAGMADLERMVQASGRFGPKRMQRAIDGIARFLDEDA